MRVAPATALLGLCLVMACAAAQRDKGGLLPVETLSADAVEKALGPRRLALLVGINHFEDARWPALKHAVADARELGQLLADPALGRFDQIEILAEEGGVTRAKIEAAFQRLVKANLSAQDTVFVYFSTHGTLARGPDGKLGRYLVTSDSVQAQIAESALAVGELLKRFEALPSRRKAFVLASCHSGSGKSALPQSVAAELQGIKGAFFVKPLRETSQASMVMTACAWGETAREDDSLKHDIYTHFLIEALRGKDEDGDGAVTASEAHAHAMARTYYFSKGRQRPQVESSILGADPIVLSGQPRRRADPVLYSFLEDLAGMRLEVNGQDKGPLPARLVLKPGSHQVALRSSLGGKILVHEEVELMPGQRLAVESLLEKSRHLWSIQAWAGYQSFLDATTRSEYVAPSATLGLSVTKRHFPLESLALGLDVGLAGGRQSLELPGLSYEHDLLQLSYGIKLLFLFGFGDLELSLGPRLGALHLWRTGLPGESDTQHVANFTPGLQTGFTWRLWRGLQLGLEFRIHFMSIHTLDASLDTGFVDLMLGAGWGF